MLNVKDSTKTFISYFTVNCFLQSNGGERIIQCTLDAEWYLRIDKWSPRGVLHFCILSQL